MWRVSLQEIDAKYARLRVCGYALPFPVRFPVAMGQLPGDPFPSVVFVEIHPCPRYVTTWRERERHYRTSETECNCTGFATRGHCCHSEAVRSLGGVERCRELLGATETARRAA